MIFVHNTKQPELAVTFKIKSIFIKSALVHLLYVYVILYQHFDSSCRPVTFSPSFALR